MLKFAKILLVIASIFYPLVVVFKAEFAPLVVIVLAFLWGIRAVLEKREFFIFSAFFLIVFFLKDLKFYYPVVVNLVFLGVFSYSLKGEAIITKLAKIKEPNLPQNVIKYTRNLTKIWCLFFAFNTLVSWVLIYVDETIWAIYCGVVSYVLVGALFSGEILYRKIFLKDDR